VPGVLAGLSEFALRGWHCCSTTKCVDDVCDVLLSPESSVPLGDKLDSSMSLSKVV